MNSLSLEPTGVAAPTSTASTTSRQLPEPGIAERLLSPSHDCQSIDATRLATGFVGLFALGAISRHDFVVAFDGATVNSTGTPLGGAGLALAAALTVAVSLPGLLILLPMLGQQVSIEKALHSVCRQYARLGILALGLSPLVLLYTLTGADPELIVVMTAACYLGAGALSLAHLFRDIHDTLAERRALARLCLFAWAGYTGVLAFYLFGKLSLGVVS